MVRFPSLAVTAWSGKERERFGIGSSSPGLLPDVRPELPAMIGAASGIGNKRPQGQLKRDMQAVSDHPPRSSASTHLLRCLAEGLVITRPDGR